MVEWCGGGIRVSGMVVGCVVLGGYGGVVGVVCVCLCVVVLGWGCWWVRV